MIIVASGSARPGFPGPAAEVALQLGLETTPALDVPMASAGGLFGMAMAAEMAARFGDVLVIGAEKMSAVIESGPLDANTAMLFGDGAGAALVSARPGRWEILDAVLHTDGQYRDSLAFDWSRAAAHERAVGDLAGCAEAAFVDRGSAGAAEGGGGGGCDFSAASGESKSVDAGCEVAGGAGRAGVFERRALWEHFFGFDADCGGGVVAGKIGGGTGGVFGVWGRVPLGCHFGNSRFRTIKRLRPYFPKRCWTSLLFSLQTYSSRSVSGSRM